jgi:hypothetical protein
MTEPKSPAQMKKKGKNFYEAIVEGNSLTHIAHSKYLSISPDRTYLPTSPMLQDIKQES